MVEFSVLQPKNIQNLNLNLNWKSPHGFPEWLCIQMSVSFHCQASLRPPIPVAGLFVSMAHLIAEKKKPTSLWFGWGKVCSGFFLPNSVAAKIWVKWRSGHEVYGIMDIRRN